MKHGEPIAFVDTETTGLYHYRGHDMWEWGSIRTENWEEFSNFYDALDRGDDVPCPTSVKLCRIQTRPSLTNADPEALRISGYFDRIDNPHARHDFAHLAEEAVRGATWVGAIPSFDKEFLEKALIESGCRPIGTWHYHLIDIESVLIGWSRDHTGGPPWKYRDLLAALDPAINEMADLIGKHTAFGDAFIVLLVYGWVLYGMDSLLTWQKVWDYFVRELGTPREMHRFQVI